MKKLTLNQIKGRLDLRKEILFSKMISENGVNTVVHIQFWRLDLVSDKYLKETYVLILTKCKEGVVPDVGQTDLDIREEFSNLDDLFEFVKKTVDIDIRKEFLIIEI